MVPSSVALALQDPNVKGGRMYTAIEVVVTRTKRPRLRVWEG